MAISVTGIATGTGGVSSTTFSITVPAGGVPSGALLLAFLSSASASGSPTISDTASNSFTSFGLQYGNGSAANGYAQPWYAKNCNALSSGNTIVFTYVANSGGAAGSAIYATGIDTTAPLDTSVTATAGGSSTTPSVTSGTPGVAGELFVSWVFLKNTTNATTVTNDTGHSWTAPFSKVSGGAYSHHYAGYQVNSGSSAITYAPTFSVTGTWAVGVAGFKAAVSGVVGTASITEADDTSSSAGVVTVVGAASITEAADTISSAGIVPVIGTSSITEAGDTVSSAGTLAIVGTSSITEADDTISNAGVVAVVGTASITEDGDTVSSAGTVAVVGSASISESEDTVAAAGTVAIVGAANITEDADTVSSVGGSGLFAQAAITEADDSVSSAGTVAISGSASIAEDGDTAAGEGTVTGEGDQQQPQTLGGKGRKRRERNESGFIFVPQNASAKETVRLAELAELERLTELASLRARDDEEIMLLLAA